MFDLIQYGIISQLITQIHEDLKCDKQTPMPIIICQLCHWWKTVMLYTENVAVMKMGLYWVIIYGLMLIWCCQRDLYYSVIVANRTSASHSRMHLSLPHLHILPTMCIFHLPTCIFLPIFTQPAWIFLLSPHIPLLALSPSSCPLLPSSTRSQHTIISFLSLHHALRFFPLSPSVSLIAPVSTILPPIKLSPHYTCFLSSHRSIRFIRPLPSSTISSYSRLGMHDCVTKGMDWPTLLGHMHTAA